MFRGGFGLVGVELVFGVDHQVVELLEFGWGQTLQLEDWGVFEVIEQVLFALEESLAAFEQTDLQVDGLLGYE